MTLKNRFDVTLRFLSDWHIGTGQGRLGTIDAEIRRDATGLPFVPAKTLIGVWRDACETVAATFDRTIDQSGPWSAWVTWLFGSQVGAPTPDPDQGPLPAALRVTPARAPAWLRHRVQRYPALAAATVVLRPGVQIDDETGTAADHLLRVEERAIQGLVLYAQVSVGDDQDSPLPEPAELLLRAGARLVEAIGSKRSRGSGRVAFLLPDAKLHRDHPCPTVTDAPLTALLTKEVPTPPPWSATRPTIHAYARRHQGPRRTVRLVLRAATPVVAAAGVISNITLCRDSIPGTALLRTVLDHLRP
ncbi:MAG TPA: RAMP superfamily CRISPR-associated protein, partial [Natronosporangium sp.]|nr:RAMP superfamily CRISPR-associated protein [Natronosporangium sp.]